MGLYLYKLGGLSSLRSRIGLLLYLFIVTYPIEEETRDVSGRRKDGKVDMTVNGVGVRIM